MTTNTAPVMLRSAAQTDPVKLAGAIAYAVRDAGRAEIQAVGMAAINAAVKAIAIARGYVAPMGHDLVCVPAFVDTQIEGETKTAIRFVVEPKR